MSASAGVRLERRAEELLFATQFWSIVAHTDGV
jgi:hypothetical protein